MRTATDIGALCSSQVGLRLCNVVQQSAKKLIRDYALELAMSLSGNSSVDVDTYLDELEAVEARWGLGRNERKTGDKRQTKGGTKTAKAEHAAALAVPSGGEGGITMSYIPARFETVWLTDSVRSFYEQYQITDVLAQVKGGKEANVYRCAGDPSTGAELLAAKVYRPRQFRNLRNDKMYSEGRTILTADGRAVKETDHRLMRAIGKKTATGQQVTHTSWLMHEYTTLERLHALGAAVPKPYAVNGNALLMSYIGDEVMAAPTLNGVHLARDEAEVLLGATLHNIGLMLTQGLIHGDLSAYNILYWEGDITLIDFPQVTHSATNDHAFEILLRDVTRVCEYFMQQGVRCSPVRITEDLWDLYAEVNPEDKLADASMYEEVTA